MKKITSCIATILILAMLPISAFAAGSVTSFSDVPSTHWAHANITAMTANGLFKGTTDPLDGVGTFAPESTMTRAEFITVVMRALYNSELGAMEDSNPWWANAYKLAIDKGILTAEELDNGAMDANMSRQEMAMVLIRAANETPEKLVPTSKIADYNTVNDYYKDYVVKAYSLGMLTGTDDKGTYAPNATMTRAQGATVLNRLTNKSARAVVDFTEKPPVMNTDIIYPEQKTVTLDLTTPLHVGINEEGATYRSYLVNNPGYTYVRITYVATGRGPNIMLYKPDGQFIDTKLVGPDDAIKEIMFNVAAYSSFVVTDETRPEDYGEVHVTSMTLENPAPVPATNIPAGVTALTDANTEMNEFTVTYSNEQFHFKNTRSMGAVRGGLEFKNNGYSTLIFTVTTKHLDMQVNVWSALDTLFTERQPANTTKTYTVDISGKNEIELCTIHRTSADSTYTSVYVK